MIKQFALAAAAVLFGAASAFAYSAPSATSYVDIRLPGVTTGPSTGPPIQVTVGASWDSTLGQFILDSDLHPHPSTGSGGGGGGGTTFNGVLYQSVGVSTDSTHGAFVQDVLLDALISGGRLPVSGTFWQTTQPVSGTFWQTTQPVSGTFWQTTQPVSIATMPPLTAGSALIGKVGIDQTTPGITNAVAATNTDFGPEGSKPTYTAAFVLTPSAGQGVIVQLQGPSLGLIRVRQIRIGAATGGTGAVLTFILTRTTTSAGAGTAIVTAKSDSTAATDAATAQYYSTVGTLGTSAGVVDVTPFYVGVAANVQKPYDRTFGVNGETALMLRSGEYLCISNGTANWPASSTIAGFITYTKE